MTGVHNAAVVLYSRNIPDALDIDNFFADAKKHDNRSISPSPYIPTPSHHIHTTMDSLGGSGLNDPKTALMRQVQQEAAMQNARMLVEVLPLTQ